MNSFLKFYLWYSVTICLDLIQIRPNSSRQTEYCKSPNYDMYIGEMTLGPPGWRCSPCCKGLEGGVNDKHSYQTSIIITFTSQSN
jgi:hypothetical protein